MLTKDIEWYLERLRVEEVPQRGVVLGSVSGVVDDAGGSRGLVAFDGGDEDSQEHLTDKCLQLGSI
ncbi:hypothetical protein [Oryza sativa Japonica Group]|uniref:Uncharacterized protein n=1 Tax=Oryza sativa subsp. japonica TaxID=39947 RepID=Q5N783_ORYSJ|nr:hypothetical protein [Oryza sativa Japonica Group]